METEKFRVFSFAETREGRLQTRDIHHNFIREQQEGEIEILEHVEIESEIPNEDHFRFPIVNLTGGETKDVIKSDYRDQDFENEVTRSMIFNHDKVISTAGIFCQQDTVQDDPKERQETLKSEDGKFNDRDLVVVRKGPHGENASKAEPKSNKVTSSDGDENMDLTSEGDKKKASDRDIKGAVAANRAANTNTNKQVVTQKPHQTRVKAFRRETDIITKTERIKYKTRKIQPLVVRDTVGYQTRVLDREAMEVYNEETLAIEKMVEQVKDAENKAQDEALSLVRTDKGLEQAMGSSEIEGAEGLGQDSAASSVEVENKEVEILKTSGQKEFGFHLYGKKNFEGHYISKVEEGSGAEKAGLRVGDRLIMIGGGPSDDLKHNEVVDLIKNSTGTLKVTVRNEIQMLRKAKVSLREKISEKKLDFSNMESARPKKKQAPKSQSWKEKKRLFQNL